MRIPIIISTIFFFLLFAFDNKSGKEGFHIKSVWAYQTSHEKEIFFADSEVDFSKSPVFSFEDRAKGNIWTFYFGESRFAEKWELPPQALFHVPKFSESWYQYTKSKKQVLYQKGHERIIYWEKEYSGYPLSDSWGQNLAIISGDNSAIDVYDSNGQKKNTYAGLYLTHYCESYGPPSLRRQVYLFSEGSFIFVSKDGNQKYSIKKEDNEILFVKSCALSANGTKLAIHTLVHRETELENEEQNQSDEILVYELSPSPMPVPLLQERFYLHEIYPHLLSMAVFETGVLYGSRTGSYFYSLESPDLHWQREIQSQNRNYRLLLGLEKYLIYAEKNEMIILGEDGIEMMRFELYAAPLQFLFFPSHISIDHKEKSTVGKDELFLIRYAEALQLYVLTTDPQK